MWKGKCNNFIIDAENVTLNAFLVLFPKLRHSGCS